MGWAREARARCRAVLGLVGLLGALAGAAPAPAAAACPASSSYSSLVAGTPGLVGYWRLGESSGPAACEVTGAFGGTYSGSVALGQAGALTGDPDTAARFFAGGQVGVPSSAALNL